MGELQLIVRKDFVKFWDIYKELLPGLGRAYDALPEEVYKDGAISGRMKRLMAIAISAVTGCRGCILDQTGQALELGASTEEILEACAVAVSMGGNLAAEETTRVVQYLSELDRI